MPVIFMSLWFREIFRQITPAPAPPCRTAPATLPCPETRPYPPPPLHGCAGFFTGAGGDSRDHGKNYAKVIKSDSPDPIPLRPRQAGVLANFPGNCIACGIPDGNMYLTDSDIEKARPGQLLRDDQTWMYLRVLPSGRKSFIIKKTDIHGKLRSKTLGKYPEQDFSG